MMTYKDSANIEQTVAVPAHYKIFANALAEGTLPLPDTSKLEKLNRELEKSEKKLRKAINDEKALQHQLKQLTRKERTHRLCTRGGMLVQATRGRP